MAIDERLVESVILGRGDSVADPEDIENARHDVWTMLQAARRAGADAITVEGEMVEMTYHNPRRVHIGTPIDEYLIRLSPNLIARVATVVPLDKEGGG